MLMAELNVLWYETIGHMIKIKLPKLTKTKIEKNISDLLRLIPCLLMRHFHATPSTSIKKTNWLQKQIRRFFY